MVLLQCRRRSKLHQSIQLEIENRRKDVKLTVGIDLNQNLLPRLQRSLLSHCPVPRQLCPPLPRYRTLQLLPQSLYTFPRPLSTLSASTIHVRRLEILQLLLCNRLLRSNAVCGRTFPTTILQDLSHTHCSTVLRLAVGRTMLRANDCV